MKLLMGLLMVFSLTGCGLFGGGNPYSEVDVDVDVDSTRKAILVANAEVRAANLLLQDVVRSRSISSNDAQKALNGLQDAKNSLQLALNAVDIAGDPVEGQDRLNTAIISIDLVLAILAPLVADPQASSDVFTLSEAA